MREIGIGIVGGGYMGKAHAVAMRAVGAVFDTGLRPRLEMVCATGAASAARYRDAYGFARATADWRALVADPAVEAVVVASPQDTHLAIAGAALAAGKPVLCEKPLGVSAAESAALVAAAERAGVANMVGFNYIRTPASRFARQLIDEGAIGRMTWFRGEHAEDYLADAALPGGWKTRTRATGALFDIGSHILNAARALAGPIVAVSAAVETVHAERPAPAGGSEPVLNDDQGQIMCRFAGGAMGHVFYSRVQTGRKMGYAYEIVGTEGAIRFDQEDQNALWLYRAEGRAAERGFRRILTGPAHPDFESFCQGPGHGTATRTRS
jgi:predicted dehydrogenase